ncbi:MAG: hypothetical protein M0C28_19970 [Candidatus Moduliflexus flocculans]|nr:hypothetical protein [Candidatus Moduliflexus flocculans]
MRQPLRRRGDGGESQGALREGPDHGSRRPDGLLLRRGPTRRPSPYVEGGRVQPGPDVGVRPQARPGAAAGLHQEVPGQQARQERLLLPRLLLRPDGLQGGRRRVLRGIHGEVPRRQVTPSRPTSSASSRTRTRSTRASPWPRSSRSSPAIRGIRTTSSTWPSSTRSRRTRPRPKRNTARTSPTSYVPNAVFALTGYANFWIEQGKNLESAEEMADIVAAALAAKKDAPSYFLSQVAGIYARLGKDDKALAVYGPEIAKKNWDEQDALASYAGVLEPPGQEPRERRGGGPAVRRARPRTTTTTSSSGRSCSS